MGSMSGASKSTGSIPIHGGLADRARQAVVWNTGMSLLLSFGQFGLMLVLVRLLAPEIYGQFGLLMAVMGFLFVFSAQGVVDYAIQVRDDEEVPTQEIFTFAVCAAIVLFLAANGVALWVSSLPKYADIAGLLHWLSLTFFLHPPRALRVAMLQRELDWKRIRALHLFGFVISAIAAVTLACVGAGVLALVASTFLVPLPYIVDLFFIARWRPRWSLHYQSLRPAFRFGISRQLSELLAAGRGLVESTCIVQILGFSVFGTYGRAVGLSDVLCARVAGHALDALYPAITRIEAESARYRRVSALVLRTCAWIVCPLCVLMALLADPLVRVLLGDMWVAVIPIFPWVVAVTCTGAIARTLYRLLLGNGQQGRCLFLDLVMLTGTVAAIVVLLPAGLVLYIQGILAVQLLAIAVSAYLLVTRRGIEITPVVNLLLAPGIPVGAAWLVGNELGLRMDESLPEILRVSLQAIGFLGTYVVLLRLLFSRQLQEIVPYLPMGRPVRRFLALG